MNKSITDELVYLKNSILAHKLNLTTNHEIAEVIENTDNYINNCSPEQGIKLKNKMTQILLNITQISVPKILELSDQKDKKFDYINGPVSLFELHDLSGKCIYLFGDKHIYGKGCDKNDIKSPSIAQFLDKTIWININKNIDIYMEVPYVNSANPSNKYILSTGEGPLQETISEFIDCFQVDKKICKYPKNIRFHYIDIRFEIYRKLDGFLQSYMQLCNTNQLFRERENFTQIYGDLIKSFKNKENSYKQIISLFDQNEAFKILKIFKQLDHCSAVDRNMLNNYFESRFTGFHKMTYQNFDEMIQLIDMYTAPAIYAANRLNYLILTMNNYMIALMDTYALARILRTYTNGPQAQNIMVFAGFRHINNYVEFFTNKLGWKLTNQTQNEDLQCIDLSKFKQPFFDNSYIVGHSETEQYFDSSRNELWVMKQNKSSEQTCNIL